MSHLLKNLYCGNNCILLGDNEIQRPMEFEDQTVIKADAELHI